MNCVDGLKTYYKTNNWRLVLWKALLAAGQNRYKRSGPETLFRWFPLPPWVWWHHRGKCGCLVWCSRWQEFRLNRNKMQVARLSLNVQTLKVVGSNHAGLFRLRSLNHYDIEALYLSTNPLMCRYRVQQTSELPWEWNLRLDRIEQPPPTIYEVGNVECLIILGEKLINGFDNKANKKSAICNFCWIRSILFLPYFVQLRCDKKCQNAFWTSDSGLWVPYTAKPQCYRW